MELQEKYWVNFYNTVKYYKQLLIFLLNVLSHKVHRNLMIPTLCSFFVRQMTF